MTITEAVLRVREFAEEHNIDLSEYDDEDLITMALNHYMHDLVDIFDEELAHG